MPPMGTLQRREVGSNSCKVSMIGRYRYREGHGSRALKNVLRQGDALSAESYFTKVSREPSGACFSPPLASQSRCPLQFCCGAIFDSPTFEPGCRSPGEQWQDSA